MVYDKDKAKRTKRFSVTLDVRDYRRLKALADEHRPPLTLQYVVNYAIQDLLARTADVKSVDLGDPLQRDRPGAR